MATRFKRQWNNDKSSNPTPLWTISPFKDSRPSKGDTTDLAVGDINGDGYADVVASLGGKSQKGVVEIYSGQDQSLLARFKPFAGVN